MPRLIGPAFLTALALASLLALGGGQALANHVQCGDVITQDTKLDSDLIDCPAHGIVVGADDITLDLNGHTIDGDAARINGNACMAGVANGALLPTCSRPADESHEGVTVTGGTIREFGLGVFFFTGADDAVVRELAVSGIRLGEIRVQGTRNATVEDNQAQIEIVESSRASVVGNRSTEIYLESVVDSRVERNLAAHGTHGIRVVGGRDILVSRNRVLDNAVGIDVFEGGTAHRISRNEVSGNATAGIVLLDDGNILERNVVTSNGQGIAVRSNMNRVERNRVIANRDNGITLGKHYTLGGNLVDRNFVAGNGMDGIFAAGGEGLGDVIAGNVTSHNGDDGIDVDRAGTVVAVNRANGNGDLGIEAVPESIDGGRNRAFGNGNPLQCVNVFCR